MVETQLCKLRGTSDIYTNYRFIHPKYISTNTIYTIFFPQASTANNIYKFLGVPPEQESDMDNSSTLHHSEKAIVILRRKMVATNGRNNKGTRLESVSMRSRNGAPSRKGRVVNGQMTKASNK